eukprot:6710486-Ditylum_brightwellii.AAC.1
MPTANVQDMAEEAIKVEEATIVTSPNSAISRHQQSTIIGHMESQAVTTIPAGIVRTEEWATRTMPLLSTAWEAAPRDWNDG